MSLFEWYLARASGIVAFVLLTIAVLLGLTLSGRAKLRDWPRFAVEDLVISAPPAWRGRRQLHR